MSSSRDELMNTTCTQTAKNTAIIGISLGNSYFTYETITNLLLFCTENFQETSVLINDIPAIHNYLALAYDKKKAMKKARLNGNPVRNLLKRVLSDLNCDSVRILDWEKDIFSTPSFESAYSSLLSLYFKKELFFNSVRQTTLQVLLPKTNNGLVSQQALDEAVHYLLKELAFLQASPTILSSQTTSYVYHDSWPIYEKLIVGFFDGEIRSKLRFVLFP